MATEVFIPKMTDHMESGTLVRWLVREGDPVSEQQVILEVETDKAVAELEAPAAGILKGIRVGAIEGAQVPVGEPIAFIAAPEESVPVLPPLGSAIPAPSSPPVRPAEPVPAEGGAVRATPVARRVARELGVDIAVVPGSGPGGRVTEEDVRTFAARREASVPEVSQSAEEAAYHWEELTPAQRLTGQRMLQSVLSAPQFVLHASADMTQVLWLREALLERIQAETGVRLSITAILVRAVAAALRQHPRVNAAFEDGRIRLYQDINVGVAMAAPGGLVVPVVRHADTKTLAQITRELRAFQAQAEAQRLRLEDLTGGTFTLSNLGMYGVERFEAIINPPQAAILAVGQVAKTPVVLPDDTVAVRPLMALSLTVDHRALDGVAAAEFLAEVKERLEKPYFML
jgi:pyruvate dehydrogenase E2 component (dihydrolipoamide acetyltransferase)